MSRVAPLLAAVALAACARVDDVRHFAEARVTWEGQEANGWKTVKAPGYARRPVGASVAIVEWDLPANTQPGVNIGFVPRRAFSAQLDDGPRFDLHPVWTLVPYPADGAAHLFRVWAVAHEFAGVDDLGYGVGASPLFAEFVRDGFTSALAAALLLLSIGLFALSLRAPSPKPMRGVAGIALALSLLDLFEHDITSAALGVPVFAGFVIHELGMLLPTVSLSAYVRATLGDLNGKLLWWSSRLAWGLMLFELGLASTGQMYAARLRIPAFLLVLLTLVLSALVAKRERKKGSRTARLLLIGLVALFVLVIPGMLESINLMPAGDFNYARWGVLSLLGCIGYALVLADHDKTEALRLRVDELEKSRLEIEGLNVELRRQVADKSRALATSVEANISGNSSKLPSVGEVFDNRYVVLRVVGTGGMGAVFEVRRIVDKKPYALKLMTGHTDVEAAARFLREAEIAARIHHPNLVAVIDVGSTSTGTLFLVMELVSGWSLDRLEDRWQQRGWALDVLLQIARGMRALHKDGVVHRDLKPANVLVSDGPAGEPLVKLTDFGIAHQTPEGRQLAQTLPPNAVEGNKLTQAGTTIGTPRYMPPDLVYAAAATTPEADAFSFGVMACEVLCGVYPFTLPPALEVMAGIKPNPAALAFLETTGLPRSLRKLLGECLSVTAPGRPSAGDLIAALEEALDVERSTASTLGAGKLAP